MATAVAVPAASSASLVGRADEWISLCDVLEEAKAHGLALLISGEPGIGKTALLERCISRARAFGFTALTATGVEFEAGYHLAALHQLLLPLKGSIERAGGTTSKWSCKRLSDSVIRARPAACRSPAPRSCCSSRLQLTFLCSSPSTTSIGSTVPAPASSLSSPVACRG